MVLIVVEAPVELIIITKQNLLLLPVIIHLSTIISHGHWSDK